jgi:hypothetical protein
MTPRWVVTRRRSSRNRRAVFSPVVHVSPGARPVLRLGSYQEGGSGPRRSLNPDGGKLPR